MTGELHITQYSAKRNMAIHRIRSRILKRTCILKLKWARPRFDCVVLLSVNTVLFHTSQLSSHMYRQVLGSKISYTAHSQLTCRPWWVMPA